MLGDDQATYACPEGNTADSCSCTVDRRMALNQLHSADVEKLRVARCVLETTAVVTNALSSLIRFAGYPFLEDGRATVLQPVRRGIHRRVYLVKSEPETRRNTAFARPGN
jgi:hypothetical protein